MKTLYLLRHAKAERDAPSGEDFDRPLAPRGRGDASEMGIKMAAKGYFPELILASPSARTIQTIEHLTATWAKRREVQADKRLYLASASRMIELVKIFGHAAGSVMIVAHNPGLEELALQLSNRVPSEPFRRMQKKFPTCALAVFEVSVDVWGRLTPDLCRLSAYYTPKDLADGTAA
jgi:phosphohistidine phosphatase